LEKILLRNKRNYNSIYLLIFQIDDFDVRLSSSCCLHFCYLVSTYLAK